MDIRLKQVDILSNQNFIPYTEDEIYYKYMNKRVKNRLEEIEECDALLDIDNPLDFYDQALKVYDFKYSNRCFIKTNILLDINYGYLTILLRVNTEEKIDKSYYSFEEINDLFEKGKILLESVNIVELENDIKNPVICDNDEFLKYYDKFKDLSNIRSKQNIYELYSLLTKDRIKKDLDNLIKLTHDEVYYLIIKSHGSRLTLR